MTKKKLLCILIALCTALLCFTACDGLFGDGSTGDNGGDTGNQSGGEVYISDVSLVAGTLATEITAGETLNTSGIKLKVTYSDGTTAEVGKDKITIGSIDTGSVGTHVLTVTYEKYEVKINITVKAASSSNVTPTIVSLTYVDGSVKTKLNVGDEFDKTTAQAVVHYSDGTSKTIGATDGLYIGDIDVSMGGKQYLTLTYGGKTITVEITLTASLVGIGYDSEGFNANFDHNATDIDLSTLGLHKIYNDGTTKPLALDEIGVSYTEIFTNEVGNDKEFTVSYDTEPENAENTPYTVVIKYNVLRTIVSIEVDENSLPTNLTVGGNNPEKGITVTATYSNGDTATISSGLTFSGLDTELSGDKTVTVSYAGCEDTVVIKVSPKVVSVVPKKEVMATYTHKSNMTLATAVANGDLVVTVVYNHGDRNETVDITVSGGYTCDDEISTSTVGKHSLKLTYLDRQFTVYYIVESYIESINVKPGTAQTEIKYGEDPEISPIVLEVHYSDGETVEIGDKELMQFDYSGYDKYQHGATSYKIYYGGKECTVECTIVKKAVGIEIVEGSVASAIYADPNGTYSTSGLQIIVLYSDESTSAAISEGITVTGNVDATVYGTGTITVSYDGMSVEHTVSVVRRASSIALKEATEFSFKHFASANISDVVFVVTYADGFTKEVNASELTNTISTDNVGNAFTFTASYTDVTAAGTITVTTDAIAYEVYKYIVSVELDTDAFKTVYLPYAELDTVAVIVTYSDETTDKVAYTEGGAITHTALPSTETLDGIETTLEITYAGFDGEIAPVTVKVLSVAFAINVTEEIIDKNDAEAYNEILARLTVTATYGDGNTVVYGLDKLTVSELALDICGKHTVTATVTELPVQYNATLSFGVEIMPILTAITLTNPEVINTTYFVGGMLNLDAAIFEVSYDGAETATLTYLQAIASGIEIKNNLNTATATAIGETRTLEITAEYRATGVTVANVAIEYTVDRELLDATISFNESEYEFILGTDAADWTIAANGDFNITYKDTNETVNVLELDGVTIVCEYDKDAPKAGTYTVTVEYKGLIATTVLRVHNDLSNPALPEEPDGDYGDTEIIDGTIG